MEFRYWSKLTPLILPHLPCLFVNDFRRLCRTNEQMLSKYAFSWFLLNGSFLWNLFHLDIWFYGKSTEQSRDFLLIICQKPFYIRTGHFSRKWQFVHNCICADILSVLSNVWQGFSKQGISFLNWYRKQYQEHSISYLPKIAP